LNDALRSAGLFALQEEMDEGPITLDSQIASAGGNLSVGQKQILALARAIIRKSKLLILDEGEDFWLFFRDDYSDNMLASSYLCYWLVLLRR
jgi:ABC-type uncharacterized transport system YnjBCD ATPase subunit